ncbi:MAG: LytTR family DNA-binding domain-containing protein [Bacteroidota bacterium]
MKILIIEDESRAANHLVRILSKVAPQAEVVARIESVKESLEWLSANSNLPDLILSDIQLADGLSFEVFSEHKTSCPIIFTTAYDHYAIEAFETNGIDYLLKPVSEARLQKALAKLENFKPNLSLEKILALAQSTTNQASYKTRFMIKVGTEIKSIPVEEIGVFFSYEKATYALVDSGRKHLLDKPLDQLEPRLDPAVFFRINRKYLASHAAISNIYTHSNSRLKLRIKGLEDHDVIVARERVSDFKEWLDQ